MKERCEPSAESPFEFPALQRSARARAFAARLLRTALVESGDELAEAGTRLARSFDAHDLDFGAQFQAWRVQLAEAGATVDLTSVFLGGPVIGVRRPARPLAGLLRAAGLDDFIAGQIPELATTGLASLAARALAVTFWVQRQRVAGATRVQVEVARGRVRLRANGGGEACAEFDGGRTVAARGTAFTLWPRPWFDAN